MDRKSALVLSALALAASAATAGINFTPSGGATTFTQLFDPDGGVFAAGQFTSGQMGTFMADAAGTFSLTYLGQESAYSDGIRIVVNGRSLNEGNHVGDVILGPLVAGAALDFTFFGSEGSFATNGGASTPHSTFTLLGTNMATSRGTFQYVVGYNDSALHDDWDDFVVGINVAPIPEPQTYALLLAGLGVVGFVARRRQAR
jgi:hypothetical protein